MRWASANSCQRRPSRPRPGWLVALVLLVAACGGGHDADEQAVLFHFKLHGQPASEDFRAYISAPSAKAVARAQLSLPVDQRSLHAAGQVAHGAGAFNLGWNWHFSGAVTVERVSIEACDTTPSMIAADVAYWVSAGTGACPWGSYVHAEIR
jgi:hypothetical protein